MSESTITKKAIAEALITLCETKLYNKISVQDITKQIGLNRQTFYYHFTDKRDLLNWIYQEDAFRYLMVPEVTINNWEEQTLLMLKAIKANSDFYYNTVTSDTEIMLKSFSKLIQRLFVNLFEEFDVDKELSETDKEFYARFYAYGCSGVLISWISDGFKESPLEIATQMFRLAKDTEFFSYRLYCKEEE